MLTVIINLKITLYFLRLRIEHNIIGSLCVDMAYHYMDPDDLRHSEDISYFSVARSFLLETSPSFSRDKSSVKVKMRCFDN